MTREEKRAALAQYFEFFAGALRAAPEGFAYGSIQAFTAGEGRELSAEPFTPDEEALLLSIFRHVRTPQVKSCYDTAYNLASEGLTYAEGYGVGEFGIPVDHAVGVLNGKPVDISWRTDAEGRMTTRDPAKLLARAKHNLANNVYHVVSFPFEYVMIVALRTGVYGVIPFNRELAEFGSAAYAEEVTANG